jgi:hypothetical protein
MLATARLRIDALIMYHFIYNSFGAVPQRKLGTKLKDLNQDWPLLLKTVLDQIVIATQVSTFAIKEKVYKLNLKKYK